LKYLVYDSLTIIYIISKLSTKLYFCEDYSVYSFRGKWYQRITMDKNNIIGLILIFGILMGYSYFTAPTAQQLEEQERINDSIRIAEERIAANPNEELAISNPVEVAAPEAVVPDSVKQAQAQQKYGSLANLYTGTESISVLENDLFKVSFTNKGGRIKSVELKNYMKNVDDRKKPHDQEPLFLLDDEKNKFEYTIPSTTPGGTINTGQLFFQPKVSGNKIVFTANIEGGSIEQIYSISDTYSIDYDLKLNNLADKLAPNTEAIQLKWIDYLDKIELNDTFEKNYSSVYFKEVEESPNYCSCTRDGEEKVEGRVKWVSHSNQFFNTSLVSKDAFENGEFTTTMMEEDAPDLKKITTELDLPLSGRANEQYAMRIYSGPNEFDVLKNYSPGLEMVIPYGWSIFGSINRWVIRPAFNFLSGFISSRGICILLLTFIIKLILFPLTYKMLYSQQKMAALKPRLAKLKEKFKDDTQAYSMEQMKLYREYGASPLGGCMPMVLQMPIWYALFRFFPASINFRQEGFLWADDLSSFDVAFWLPFELPFNFGAHLSLFSILWAISTVVYTYYNTKHMDMTANPAMKYMQYAMPLMFLVFFNNYASGLTCYMFFSNLLNITQTLVTKNFLINPDKLEEELKAHKKKPKKSGGFQERLQKVLAEQQKAAEEAKKKGGK